MRLRNSSRRHKAAAAPTPTTHSNRNTSSSSSTSGRGMKGRKVPPAISTNTSNVPKTITMTSQAHEGLDDSGNYIYSPILMYDDSNCTIEINVIEPGSAPWISTISGSITITNASVNTWISCEATSSVGSSPAGTFSSVENGTNVATNGVASQQYSISNPTLAAVSLTYQYNVIWNDGVKNVTTTLPKSSFDNTFTAFPHNK